MNLEEILKEYDNYIWFLIHQMAENSNVPFDHREDIYQDFVLRMVKKFPTYDESLSSIKTFLAKNVEIAFLRYRRDFYKHSNPEIEEAEFVDGDNDISRYLLHSELNEREKKVAWYMYLGNNQEEIAKQLGLSQGTISNTLKNIRKKLQKDIDNPA